jgi:hypothetical protein
VAGWGCPGRVLAGPCSLNGTCELDPSTGATHIVTCRRPLVPPRLTSSAIAAAGARFLLSGPLPRSLTRIGAMTGGTDLRRRSSRKIQIFAGASEIGMRLSRQGLVAFAHTYYRPPARPREHGRQRDRRITEKCDQNWVLGGSIIVLWLLPRVGLEPTTLRLTDAGRFLVRSRDVGMWRSLGGVRGQHGATRCGHNCGHRSLARTPMITSGTCDPRAKSAPSQRPSRAKHGARW